MFVTNDKLYQLFIIERKIILSVFLNCHKLQKYLFYTLNCMNDLTTKLHLSYISKSNAFFKFKIIFDKEKSSNCWKKSYLTEIMKFFIIPNTCLFILNNSISIKYQKLSNMKIFSHWRGKSELIGKMYLVDFSRKILKYFLIYLL